ncbi:MAG TPA: hypothetical protein VJG30_02725 [Candidatus Nanoarchaeia archaeon]|nr:hypothetical protein [Candidatus Nanoarchaeia archaeon]
MIITIDGKINRTSPVPFGEIVEDLKDSKYGVANALRDTVARGLKPVTSPRVLDLRNDCPDFNDYIWTDWYTTASGVYNVGNKVIVVHGLNHPLPDHQRLKSAIEKGLVNYGAKLTEQEVQAFKKRKVEGLRDYKTFLRETQDQDLEEQFGVVADVSLFKSLPNDYMKLAKWVKDPRAIMLSGGKRRAEAYAEMLIKKGVEKPYISLSVQEGQADRGSLVSVSSGYGYGLDGYIDLDNFGRFVGEVAGPQSVAKKIGVSLEDLLQGKTA